jgi:hypothetical protein
MVLTAACVNEWGVFNEGRRLGEVEWTIRSTQLVKIHLGKGLVDTSAVVVCIDDLQQQAWIDVRVGWSE